MTIDTSREAVEKDAAELAHEAASLAAAQAAGDEDHVAWCNWMLRLSNRMLALRDALDAAERERDEARDIAAARLLEIRALSHSCAEYQSRIEDADAAAIRARGENTP